MMTTMTSKLITNRKAAYPDHNESVLNKEVEEQCDEARMTSLSWLSL